MNKKNILIVSATSKNNYILSESIKSTIANENVNIEILKLENHPLPLFSESFFNNNKKDFFPIVKLVTDKFLQADGIVFCAPEYNGSIPPIVNNVIAWISMSTKNWRDGFNNKIGLICSHSGGEATKFVISMKLQLEHLGMVVLSRNIIVNSSRKFNKNSAFKILKQFIKLL